MLTHTSGQALGMDLAFQFLTAVGTIAVAIAAVFGDWLKAKFAILKLRLDDPKGELTTFGNGTKARFYNVVVENGRGWAPLHNVQIYLTRCMRPGPHGEFENVPYHSDLQLRWVFSELNPMSQTVGLREKKANIGYVAEDKGFILTTYFTPNNFDTVLRKNEKMRLELVAIAPNKMSKPLYVEVSWDGVWEAGSDEMARHLSVRECPSPPIGPP